jgi:short-subunit dehydrogenase
VADRPTALVTGASAGIGEQLARQLAASGHDLVLVARRRDPLERLRDDMASAHGAASEVLVADLQDRAGLDAVRGRIEDGPVAVVVNNAGFGRYGAFIEQPLEELSDMVRLDVLAVMVLSRAALGTMIPARAGKLLNVSSTAGFVPGPHGAVYHGSKAFVTSMTESLHEEARPFGVHVTALCPGFTPTEFQARADVRLTGMPGFMVTDAARVAAEGLAALDRNDALCVPGFMNKAAAVGTRLGPRGVVRRVSGRVLKQL